MAHQRGNGGVSNEMLSNTAKNPLASARVAVGTRYDEAGSKTSRRVQETLADVLAIIDNAFESSCHPMSNEILDDPAKRGIRFTIRPICCRADNHLLRPLKEG